jgi:ribonucleoside-diphosphate reductase alpha chain
MMAQVMKWVDLSISVTYMLPENADWKDVYDFIIKGWKTGVKSIAAFPDKKMYGIVSYIPFKDLAFKLKDEGVELFYSSNFTEDELTELNASKESIDVNTGIAPKRPKVLDADIHIANAKGERYVVAVGLLNGQPYEVFGGKANGFGIKQKCKGVLIKHKKGQYGLEMDNIEIDDFSKHFTPEEQTIFRLASTNLRHGIPIEFVVEQLQKSTDDMFSLPSAVARVMKKYIKDGQKVTGKKCPSCGSSELIYQDGCVSCACGWSKCQ